MAQTTTHFSNSSIVFSLDDSAGSPLLIGGSTSTATLSSEPGSSGEVYTFDGDNPLRGVGKRTYTMEVQFVMSTSTSEAAVTFQDWAATKDGQSKTATIAMPDATTGSFEWTGEWKLTSMSIPADASESTPALASATLVSDGDITWTIRTS